MPRGRDKPLLGNGRQTLCPCGLHESNRNPIGTVAVVPVGRHLSFDSTPVANTVTIEKLQSGVSYARNPVLVNFMENLGYADRSGRGMPMVYKETRKAGKEVRCAELGEDFRVVLGNP